MGLPEQKQSATQARLATLDLPQGGWSGPAREDALARVQAMGLPGARDEYWKYTKPEMLIAAVPKPAASLGDSQVFAGRDALRVVFVDGVFDADASDDLSGEGLSIARLADAQDIHWAQDLYGTLEAAGQSPVQRPLAALNTAFAADGLLIHVTGAVSRPVHLVYQHRADTSDAILHHVVKVDAGASLTLLESGAGAARFNQCLEVDLAATGQLHHIRVQGRDHDRQTATHAFARLAGESVFKSFTLTANGIMTRNECVVDILGDEAKAHVAGACMGDGDFHHDDTVFVTHDAVDCESRQVFKKVLRNGATGVFQGKILVKPDAQKTDGYQISQSLLLDDDSQFLAKPELEIYADDVACSHGSTSGAIDEDSLFYLRARGVPRGLAEDLMTIAFIAEAVQEVDDEELQEEINALVGAWLERRRG